MPVNSYDTGEYFMLNPEECIDCGACEPERSVEIIYLKVFVVMVLASSQPVRGG
jgi:ferredoxin